MGLPWVNAARGPKLSRCLKVDLRLEVKIAGDRGEMPVAATDHVSRPRGSFLARSRTHSPGQFRSMATGSFLASHLVVPAP